MFFLKQSTAYTPLIGPFLTDTDGKTAETGLTITQAEVRLSKNGGNMAQKNEATSLVHDELGYYTCPLDTTDTNTIGKLRVMVHESGALPVWEDFHVLAANVYDSLFGAATEKLEVDVQEVDGDATAAANLNSACDNYSVTRGLAGTALPNAAADAAGGLPISDAGGLDLDAVLGAKITLSGTANAGDSTVQITLTGGVATDNYYNGQLVVITSGTGIGQSRTIGKYIAAGTVATPTRDWVVAPDETSTFMVFGADVAGLLEAGVATAGTDSTITLDATASTTVDIFKNNFIAITGGTGAGQTRLIGAYSAGRVATILPNWTTNPDNTSIYMVLPMARVDVQGWAGNVVTGDGDWAALKTVADAVLSMLDDARTEPGDIAPPVNPDAMTKLDYLYKFLRNKIETTATRIHVYNDAGANKDHTSIISDDDTTFTRGEFGAGDA